MSFKNISLQQGQGLQDIITEFGWAMCLLAIFAFFSTLIWTNTSTVKEIHKIENENEWKKMVDDKARQIKKPVKESPIQKGKKKATLAQIDEKKRKKYTEEELRATATPEALEEFKRGQNSKEREVAKKGKGLSKDGTIQTKPKSVAYDRLLKTLNLFERLERLE